MKAKRLMQPASAGRRSVTGLHRVHFYDLKSSGLNRIPEYHRLRLLISIVVVTMLTAASPVAAQVVCSVPGSHSTIQSAIDDRQCEIISLSAQTYDESVHVFRYVEIAAPPQRAVIEGLLFISGSDSEVTLGNITVRNGCQPEVMSIARGARVTIGTGLIELDWVPGGPCPLLAPFFADGFESGDTSAWSNTVP